MYEPVLLRYYEQTCYSIKNSRIVSLKNCGPVPHDGTCDVCIVNVCTDVGKYTMMLLSTSVMVGDYC